MYDCKFWLLCGTVAAPSIHLSLYSECSNTDIIFPNHHGWPCLQPFSVYGNNFLQDLASVTCKPNVFSLEMQAGVWKQMSAYKCEWNVSAYLIGSFPHELLCRHFPDGRNSDHPSHVIVVKLTARLITQLLQEEKSNTSNRLENSEWAGLVWHCGLRPLG